MRVLIIDKQHPEMRNVLFEVGISWKVKFQKVLVYTLRGAHAPPTGHFVISRVVL